MRFIAVLAVFLLAGCGLFSKDEERFSCPKAGLLADASVAVFYADGGKDILSRAAIDGFQGGCSLKGKTVEAEITLPFIGRKGPAGADLKTQELSYFIAVLSPEEKVLQRQAFTTTLVFDDTGMGSVTEEHTLKIPLENPAQARKYQVVMGFALTPEQFQRQQGKESK